MTTRWRKKIVLLQCLSMTCVNLLEARPLPIFLYQCVYRDKCNSAGEVVAIVEEPAQTGEDKV